MKLKENDPELSERLRQSGTTFDLNPDYFNSRSNSRDLPDIALDYIKDFNRTDLGNSERFIHYYGDQVLYNHTSKKFLIWNGQNWEEDQSRKVGELAKNTIRAIYEEAAKCENDDLRAKIGKWATASESSQRIGAMLELAKMDQTIAATAKDLDQQIYLINLANGTYDLKEFTLKPHSPEDRLSKICNARLDPDAAAPTWDLFLDRIFDGNQNLIDFMARAVGYSLTGDTSEQCFFLLYGSGANGKSTFLNTILHLMNDYARQTAFDTILLKKDGNTRNDLAALVGTRFVSAIEGEQGRKMAESVVKQITGGDRISVRKLYQEFFEYEPTYKLWLATNHKPIIRGTDNAIWRRVKLIPFMVQIPEAEQDHHLADKLKGELPGILNWAIKGLADWWDNGLSFPDEVKTATSTYRQEMDLISGFIAECCIEKEDAETRSKDLYRAYQKWCDENSEKPISQTAFGLSLAEKGFQQKRFTGGRKGWVGIGLLADDLVNS